MASTFLATTFGNNLDYDLASAAQQARDQKGPTLPTGKQGSLSRTPWERAVYIFNNGLTKDEGKKFALNSSPNASLEAFLQQVSVAKDDAQRRKSKVLERIDSILERVTMYSKPMDVFAQTNQELMFAWGTMKFLMQVVMSEKEVAEKVAQAIADVVQIFGRCEQYTELFGEHERLLEAIGVLYADVLNLLVRATRFYQKRGIKRFLSTTASPFEIKFAPIVAAIERHANIVDIEADVARATEQKAENNLQRSFRDHIQAQQTDQIAKEVKLWLQPWDSSSDLRKLREVQTTNTCSWLLGKEEYNNWVRETESSILWIYGIPGSGKSVLASYIIERLRSPTGESTVPLIYFFCSGRDRNRRVTAHILRSFIFQLQTQHPNLANLVEQAYKDSMTKGADRFEELWTLFESMVREQTVVCVIDGLDECQERDEDGNLERSAFTHRLLQLAKEQSSEVYFKMLLTSRNEPDIRTAFHAASKLIQTISIFPSDVSKDIQTYISSRIDASNELADLSVDLKSTIVETLEQNACGMFIWARLMIQELETRDSDEAVEEALKSLPQGLSELYDRILDSIAQNFERNKGTRDLGCFVLCWAIYSSRPLTLTELSEARCIVPGQSSPSLKKKPRSLVSFRRLVEATCSPLVEVHDDGLVQLAHHSTKEYLSSRGELMFEICRPLATFGLTSGSDIDLQSILTQVCLSYVNQEVFEVPLLGSRKRFQIKLASDVRSAHPFLDYAASNWLFHLGQSGYPPYLAVRSFLEKPQVMTWVEATILIHGGVQNLATIMHHLPPLSAPMSPATMEEDCRVVSDWFNELQRVIFEWGGTLNQTPSEIHFLDVLKPRIRGNSSRLAKLQKTTLLVDPNNSFPKVRPLEGGDGFLLRQPYVYVLANTSWASGTFLVRYHWLSMQALSEISYPRTPGMMSKLGETQLSPSGRYVVAVLIAAGRITVALWSISEEGFEPLPWAQNDGVIGNISAERKSYGFSHRPAFEGPAFGRSGRYVAFSMDEKILWTPWAAYDLITGEESSVPNCCGDIDISSATWSRCGRRIACLRNKQTLEVYENVGNLTAAIHNTSFANTIIADFSQSSRYVLLLDTQLWQYSIYDIHLQTSSSLPPLSFSSDENPLGLKIPDYSDYTIVTHSFSPCEKYIYCLICSLGINSMPVILVVWDRRTGLVLFKQIWSFRASCRPSQVQFDTNNPEILHILLDGNRVEKWGQGFIHVNLLDKDAFAHLLEPNRTGTFTRYDLCVSPSGGRVFQKDAYELHHSKDDIAELVDVISWNLKTCPPEIDCRFTVPRKLDCWAAGYAQSNGAYDDWFISMKDSSMVMLGSQMFCLADKSTMPTAVRDFQPGGVWNKIARAIKDPPQGEKPKSLGEDIHDLETQGYWSYLSPDESLVCFYVTKVYIAVFDVESGNLRWCHRLKGKGGDYWMEKPAFHPTRPLMAWIEQYGKDGKEDFEPYRDCGVYIVNLSSPENLPVRLEDLTVDCRSDFLFSHCGSFLYFSVIARDDYHNENEDRKIKLFKVDFASGKPLNCLIAYSPIKFPSYCSSDSTTIRHRLVLMGNDIYFLISLDYKVLLAKIDFDGTVRWKIVASLPGPPVAPRATVLASWGDPMAREVEGKANRLDIVLAEQQFPYPTVINSWDENPGVWDEARMVLHDPTIA